MLHLVKLIERRFPKQSERIVPVLAGLSVAAVVLGLLILLLR